MSKWLKKGDKVCVIAGNDKGKTGEVLRRKGDRIVIQGVNIRKKHVRKREASSPGIIEIEGSLHISNVMFCNEEGKGVKPRALKRDSGQKDLVYLHGGKEVVVRTLKKA